MLTPQLKIGAVGYYAQQLSADSGAGGTFGSRKLRVAGTGPAQDAVAAAALAPPS